jgi:Uma2 family endonuclease
MLRKRHDYFSAGVRLVWEVDVRSQTVAVFNEPDQGVVLDVSHTLLGDPVLPDFSIRVADLFAELDRRPKDPPHAASPR